MESTVIGLPARSLASRTNKNSHGKPRCIQKVAVDLRAAIIIEVTDPADPIRINLTGNHAALRGSYARDSRGTCNDNSPHGLKLTPIESVPARPASA